MKSFIRKLSLVFAAGALGGLVNSTVIWLFGRAGITAELGVKLAPAFTPAWLYPRLVWGGIFGILFLLPLAQNRPFQQGLLISLGPTIVQLFVIFPYQLNKGMLGLELGTLTPVFVLFFNAVWGVAAALWLWASER
ncbi:MAG TPA: hypothetical protein VGA86_11975 [Desulfatiglandales bacterium]